jgi:hypothetical protein
MTTLNGNTRSRSKALAVDQLFSTGQRVPRSGIYKILHKHSPADQMTLLRDGHFPTCHRCGIPMNFELVSAVPIESATARFRLLMRPHITQA